MIRIQLYQPIKTTCHITIITHITKSEKHETSLWCRSTRSVRRRMSVSATVRRTAWSCMCIVGRILLLCYVDASAAAVAAASDAIAASTDCCKRAVRAWSYSHQQAATCYQLPRTRTACMHHHRLTAKQKVPLGDHFLTFLSPLLGSRLGGDIAVVSSVRPCVCVTLSLFTW